ncbi:hypothetical protein [Sporosarcina obsidiansis]|uniref:hypothetical protein n=1 Tax=Sporosarcina obsidiansis TaxID=2660748 RepID=UPI00129AF104|nr:hypothetical protein [Sporosarcina obsidiansis]
MKNGQNVNQKGWKSGFVGRLYFKRERRNAGLRRVFSEIYLIKGHSRNEKREKVESFSRFFEVLKKSLA